MTKNESIAVKMQIGRLESVIKQNVEDNVNILSTLRKDNDNDYLNALKGYVTENNLKGKRTSKSAKKENASVKVVNIETNEDKIKKIIASGATDTDMINQIREIYSNEEKRKEIESKIQNLKVKLTKIEEEISKLTAELKEL